MEKIRIATRQSKLAQIQARMVGDLLKETHGLDYELHFVTTTGDKFMGDLSKVGGKDAFVKEIESCLMNKEADIAVHSMKDVAAILNDGFAIPAYLPRADIRDIVIGKSLVALPEGGRVGTSSCRRASQIRATFPHLEIVPIRGNVQTRMAKITEDVCDSVILAKAGIDRLNLMKEVEEVLEPDMLMPAVGQGAIGVECLAENKELIVLLEKINDKETEVCLNAERAMVRKLDGDCHTPIAGYCEVTKAGNLRFLALVAEPDGTAVLRARHKGDYEKAEELGLEVAEDLLNQGAADIIKRVKEGR